MDPGSIFDSIFANPEITLEPTTFLLCVFSALAIGLILGFVYVRFDNVKGEFPITIALIPAIVTVIIIAVNGNIGTGIAVAGAFSLVRFRSTPGTARDICMIFLAMSAGLLIAVGYIAYAFMFVIIILIVLSIYDRTSLGVGGKKKGKEMVLYLNKPNGVDCSVELEKVLERNCIEYALDKVKNGLNGTSDITYRVMVSDEKHEKTLVEEIQALNEHISVSLFSQKADK